MRLQIHDWTRRRRTGTECRGNENASHSDDILEGNPKVCVSDDKNTAFATQKQLCFIKCTQQHITKRKLKNRRREEMLQSMKRKKTTILKSWLQVLRFNNWKRTDIAHETKPFKLKEKTTVPSWAQDSGTGH